MGKVPVGHQAGKLSVRGAERESSGIKSTEKLTVIRFVIVV